MSHEARILNAGRLMSIFTQSMVLRQEIAVTGADRSTHVGIVNSIEAEDGSGFRYNIRLSTGETVFVKV